MAKNSTTKRKEQVLKDLFYLDSKFKFTNPRWNASVKSAFSESGSFSFDSLVHDNLPAAESLILNFS